MLWAFPLFHSPAGCTFQHEVGFWKSHHTHEPISTGMYQAKSRVFPPHNFPDLPVFCTVRYCRNYFPSQEIKSMLQIYVFWAWWDSVNCLTSVLVCPYLRQSRSFLPSWGFLLALLPLIRPKRKAKKKKPLKHRSDETPLSCTRTAWTEERRGRHLSGTGVCVGGTWASNVIARLECMR